MGFRRYKEPLVQHFQKEINENGELQKCKRSLKSFWLPLLNENSAAYLFIATHSSYIRKTKENPGDRADSIFFKHLVEPKEDEEEDDKSEGEEESQ